MKKLYLIFFLGITFLLSDENRWSSTRFEHWWNKNFNSMSFREPFSFMPYKIKVGTFQYGGDDFWKQFFSEGITDLNNSPFIIDGDVDFNFVDDIKFRKGLDLEIDFLGYNFFQNLQNSVDIITSFSYKLSKPLEKSLASGWPDQNSIETYYYYPVLHSYNINTLFAVQLSEKFSPYIRYSYGLIDGELFRDENNDGVINAGGKTEGFDLGFNIISELKNKDYNLMYGFEIGLDKIQIDDISDTYSNPIIAINSNDIALRFTIGIMYGGKKTDGDKGFNYLINSDYLDAIDNFNQFKINHKKHPKIKLANKMIEFSRTQVAYDMLYNGIDCYRNNKIDSALIWYNNALDETQDSVLIYEVQSRKYIIADKLFNHLDESYYQLSIDDKINHLEYIASISDGIKPTIEFEKITLLYNQADTYLENGNYVTSYEMYQKNQELYPHYEYMYIGKINSLVSLIIQMINDAAKNQNYFQAYEATKFLNIVYPNINDYIEDNLNILKLELDLQNSQRRDELILEIINEYKDRFKPIDDNTLIQLGDSYEKAMRLLGDPIEVKHRSVNSQSYFMAVYNFKNNIYRLFFENDILFDLIKE